MLDYLARSATPVYLSDLGQSLHENFGKQIQATNWFGYSTSGSFLRALPGAGLQVEGIYVWDPSRHDPPLDKASAVNNSSSLILPSIIDRICQANEMPRLSAGDWPNLFEKLAEYAQTHPFNLTECTAWVRDKLRESGVQVGRQSVGYAVKGALMGGVSLKADPPPNKDRIREGLTDSIILRAESQGVSLGEQASAAILAWFAGERIEAAG